MSEPVAARGAPEPAAPAAQGPAPAAPQAPPQAPAPAHAPPHAPVHRGLITVAVMAATLMQVLDMTIVNVALPHMQGNLSATVDQISWVLTSYIVASAVMTLPTGWLSGRFGRKRLLLFGVGGFTLASTLCGLSSSLAEIVLFRLLQGAFGAVLAPLAQSTLLDTYPRERHGQAMAIYGMGLMVGPILGPTLGGYLTESYTWRWVFFINVPVGIACMALVALYLRETELDRERPFDFFGFAMLSLGIGALQLLLDRGQGEDWFSSSEIIIETALAALGFYVFLAHSFTTSQPFVDLRIFKDRNFSAGALLMFCAGVILLATLALMPPFMENLLGYPVLTVGLVMAPRGMATMFAMFMVGRLVGKVDPRHLVLLGIAMIMGAFWIMTGFNLDVSIMQIIWPGLLQGAGMGLLMIPMITVAFSSLPARSRTEASAIFNLVRNVGSSIGISIMFTLLTRNLQANHANLTEHISPYNPMLRALQLPGGLDPTAPRALAALEGMVSRQAAIISYVNDFKVMMVMALLVIPLVFLLRKPTAPQTAGAGPAAPPPRPAAAD
jgi:MFS transporter, DHA2 family, multidrug resistance protein